ncbi:MAG: methyltransferase [Acidimicrobiales bacterium]
MQPYEGARGTVADLFQVRTVPFAFHGARLRFDLASTVFASAGIDPGSALLLRHLQTVLKEQEAAGAGPAGGGEIRRVLDLGCGHGVLGLTLLALGSQRQVTLVDRDALALAYTARNLALNGLPVQQAHVIRSLGYDDVDRSEPFDLVVSNIPGKAGEAVIAELVAAPEPWGRVGTLVAVVVVAPLADQVRQVFAPDRFDLLADKGTKAHQVLIARRTAGGAGPLAGVAPATGFDAGRYDRGRGRFQAADLAWEAETVTGIEEFDSLSHATRLLRPALRGLRAGPCTVVNPGQGHRALVAARSGQRLTDVVSRDLLALRATARLLAANGVPAAPPSAPNVTGDQPRTPPTAYRHGLSVPPPGRFGTVIVHADDKVHTPWLAHELRELITAGTGLQLVLTGRASLLGRLEADLLSRHGGRLFYKQGRDGYRVVRYQYRPSS